MEAILWILFVLACVLVSTVILLQEGKGGGLSEAFGGVGQQTFGVKAEGINKFTGWVSFVVVVLAVVITRVRSDTSVVDFAPATPAAQEATELVPAEPADGTPADTAPADTAPDGQAPAGDTPVEGDGK
jgi:preprotein translocase subunit SecG